MNDTCHATCIGHWKIRSMFLWMLQNVIAYDWFLLDVWAALLRISESGGDAISVACKFSFFCFHSTSQNLEHSAMKNLFSMGSISLAIYDTFTQILYVLVHRRHYYWSYIVHNMHSVDGSCVRPKQLAILRIFENGYGFAAPETLTSMMQAIVSLNIFDRKTIGDGLWKHTFVSNLVFGHYFSFYWQIMFESHNSTIELLIDRHPCNHSTMIWARTSHWFMSQLVDDNENSTWIPTRTYCTNISDYRHCTLENLRLNKRQILLGFVLFSYCAMYQYCLLDSV